MKQSLRVLYYFICVAALSGCNKGHFSFTSGSCGSAFSPDHRAVIKQVSSSPQGIRIALYVGVNCATQKLYGDYFIDGKKLTLEVTSQPGLSDMLADPRLIFPKRHTAFCSCSREVVFEIADVNKEYELYFRPEVGVEFKLEMYDPSKHDIQV